MNLLRLTPRSMDVSNPAKLGITLLKVYGVRNAHTAQPFRTAMWRLRDATQRRLGLNLQVELKG